MNLCRIPSCAAVISNRVGRYRLLMENLKPIVGLDAFHPDAPACIPLEQLFQEDGDGDILVQTLFRVIDTPARHYLHVHLDPLAGIVYLLIELWGCKPASSLPAESPSFLMNRRSGSPDSAYSSASAACEPVHSSTIPRLGLWQRISRISFNSASAC